MNYDKLNEEKELRQQEGLERLPDDYYSFQETLSKYSSSEEPSAELDQIVLSIAKKKETNSIIKFVWPLIAVAAVLLLSINLMRPSEPINSKPQVSQSLPAENKKATENVDLFDDVLESYEMASHSSSQWEDELEDLEVLEGTLEAIDEELNAYGF